MQSCLTLEPFALDFRGGVQTPCGAATGGTGLSQPGDTGVRASRVLWGSPRLDSGARPSRWAGHHKPPPCLPRRPSHQEHRLGSTFSASRNPREVDLPSSSLKTAFTYGRLNVKFVLCASAHRWVHTHTRPIYLLTCVSEDVIRGPPYTHRLPAHCRALDEPLHRAASLLRAAGPAPPGTASYSALRTQRRPTAAGPSGLCSPSPGHGPLRPCGWSRWFRGSGATSSGPGAHPRAGRRAPTWTGVQKCCRRLALHLRDGGDGRELGCPAGAPLRHLPSPLPYFK